MSQGNTDLGILSEAKFVYEAYRHGLTVLQPTTHCTPYDFVVDTGENLWKVQVKSTATLQNVGNKKNVYRVLPRHGREHTKYEGGFDFLACYVAPEDTWYLIPFSHINGGSICLYPHRSTGKETMYEVYKENWKIFFE